MNHDDWIDGQYQNYLSAKEFDEAEIRRNLEKYHTFRSPHEANKQVQPAADIRECDTPPDLHQGEGKHISDGAAQQSSDRPTQA
jgi:hypothetical protein